MIKTKFWIFCGLVLLLGGLNFVHTTARMHEDALTVAGHRLAAAADRLQSHEMVAQESLLSTTRALAAREDVMRELGSADRGRVVPDASRLSGRVGTLERGGESARPLVILATSQGGSVLRADGTVRRARDPEQVPSIRAALDGEARVGLQTLNGDILRIAGAPVTTGGDGGAAVLVGSSVDSDYLARLTSMAGVDVSIINWRGVARSPLPADVQIALERVADGAQVGRAFAFGERHHFLAPLTRAVLGSNPPMGYAVLTNSESWDGTRVLLSYTPAATLTAIEEYQTRQVFALAALALLGLLWGFYITESVRRPVNRIAVGVGRVANGDVKARLRVGEYGGMFRPLAELINGAFDQAMRTKAIRVSTVGSRDGGDLSGMLNEEDAEAQVEATPASDSAASSETDEQRAPGLGLFEDDAFQSADEEPTDAPAPDLTGLADLEERYRPRTEPPVAEDESSVEALLPGEDSSEADAPEREAASAEAPGAVEQSDDAQDDDSESLADMVTRAAAQDTAAAFGDEPQATGSLAEMVAQASAEDEAPVRRREATVVTRIPEALLQATAKADGGEGGPDTASPRDPDEAHFQDVFDEFLRTREECGEPTANLTFDKFAAKLRKNRDAIKEKHGCRGVRFQVHAKDGKAALKASPVR